MAGNITDWCADAWREEGPPDGRRVVREAALDGASIRVARGGSWINLGSDLRASNRGGSDSSNRNNRLGFRLARSSP